MLPTTEMVPLSKLKPSPWRNKRLNPICPKRVKSLADSIVRSGEFWVGVYGRRLANGDVELAFGHHRFDAALYVSTQEVEEAARLNGMKEIPVTICEFTDGEMLQRMVLENQKGDFPVVLEAVNAAVKALAQGKIEVEKPSKDTRKDALMCAPSFVPGLGGNSELPRCYTATSLSKFLGNLYLNCGSREGRVQASNSVKAALSTFELIERKVPGYSLEGLKETSRDGELQYKSLVQIIEMNSAIKKKYLDAQEKRGKTAADIAKLNEEKAEARKQAEQAEQERKLAEQARKKAEREAKATKDKEEAKRLREEASKRKDEEEAAEERKRIAEQAEYEKSAEQKTKEAEKVKQEQEVFVHVLTPTDLRVSEVGKVANEHTKGIDADLSKTLSLKDKTRLWEAWQAAGERCKDIMALYVDTAVAGKEVLRRAKVKEEITRKLAEKETQ